MKILWLTNIPLPEVSSLMGENPLPFGGWLINTSKNLARIADIELSISFPSNKANKFEKIEGTHIDYYPFGPIKEIDIKSVEANKSFEFILNKLKPDLVHIFGTEYAHSLAMVNQCNRLGIKTVVSIQGLISVCSKHYMAGLPLAIQKRFTIRDLLKRENLVVQQKKIKKRGELELETIKRTQHIIGRTTWDKACTSQINPEAKYHFCNETLREEFYKHTWNIEQCERFSIFTSQASYPIKGIHFVLEAMPLILKKYPQAKLYIAGYDITKSDTIVEKIKLSSYARYVKELIKKYDLAEKVIFTGLLDEKEMCQRHLKSNVFVSPSAIENESNSLSEAKLLGVPSGASYVGGVTDRIQNNIDGFHYQYDAPYMLAYYICEIFENEDVALKFSKQARENALKIHDREENLETILRIYKKIINA